MLRPRYVPGTGYIKSFATALVADGTHTPQEALRLAKEAWAKRQAAEKAVEEAMSHDV